MSEPLSDDSRKRAFAARTALVLFCIAVLGLGGLVWHGRSTALKNLSLAKQDSAGKALYLGPQMHEVYAGDPGAKIVVLEYFDLDCPFCKQYHKRNEGLLLREFEDDSVAFARRHMPLTHINPWAEAKAEALECVALQQESLRGEAIDFLYDSSPTGEGVLSREIAERFGLDEAALVSCVKEGITEQKIASDKAKGAIHGVSATPTFIVFSGGVERARVVGNRGREIDAAIRLLLGER